MNLSEIYKEVNKSVVALAIENVISDNESQYHIFGSGICVDSKGIFLTAKHCVADEKIQEIEKIDFHILKGWYQESDGSYAIMTFKPTNILANKDFDIAFLTVDNIKDFNIPSIKIKSKGSVLVGESVGCAGYPITDSTIRNPLPNLFSGIVSRIELNKIDAGITCDNIILDMSLHPGNSGGPVFNYDGELIAIVSSQELRKLDNIDDYESEIKSEFEKWRAWTNLIHCVPYTVFMHTVSDLKRMKNG